MWGRERERERERKRRGEERRKRAEMEKEFAGEDTFDNGSGRSGTAERGDPDPVAVGHRPELRLNPSTALER